ncbi:hypothetical protein DFP73DRAFT_634612 [Morchella snyderi]|nr:hypothetical protein DFP73DRAFT_634612 [Morchella snyderi]
MVTPIDEIRQKRNQISTKIQDFSERGPKVSRQYHAQVVDYTLIAFDVLYKLAVCIRGDYDARTDGNTEVLELEWICEDLKSAAMQAELVSIEGVNVMSRVTEEMMECRSVEIAKLIKSVEDGKTDARDKIGAAREARRIQQDSLDQARWSLETARNSFSTSVGKLRDTERARREFKHVKAFSWIVPPVGAIINIVDAIAGHEDDLNDSINRLRNTISDQKHNVEKWESDIAKTESNIRTATCEMDIYSHTLNDMKSLEESCNDLLKMSQETEKQLVALKITMRKLFVITANLHSKAKDTSYVTDKAEILGVILDTLGEDGLIDDRLQNKTLMIIDEVRSEDTTGLLLSWELHQKVEKLNLKAIMSGDYWF